MTRQSFLELDSTYRNRNLDSKVSDFTVTVSQTGIRKQESALDPVSNAYPVNVFNYYDNTIAVQDSNTIVFPNPTYSLLLTLESFDDLNNNIVNTSSSATLILSCGASLGTQSGLFNGCVLVSQYSTGLINVDDEYRRILDWKYLLTKDSKYYYKVVVESMINVPTTQSGGPLPATVKVSSSQPKINQTFNIYNPSDFSDKTRPYLFLPSSLAIPNYYNKYIVYNQTKKESVNIVSYDMDTHLALLGDITNKNSWDLISNTFVIRQEAPVQTGSANANGTTATIPVGSAFFSTHPPSFYINAFVRFTSGNNNNSIRKISGTSGVPPNTLVVSTPFSFAVQNTDTFEILQYSYDNYSPFVYTGTTSNSQPVAYEICLNSLILPNVFLTNGGRIAYYPYVYVVLENLSSTSGNPRNMIYSNNPNNYKAVFRAPITDLNHPNNSPFVKLTGNGMKQTMVFKQNEDVHVSVLLPNGSLFEPITQDNPAGQAPNPLIQVSFVFSFERIE